MTEREKAIAEILKREIRLVSNHDGEICQRCGSFVDYTWRVKDGNIEHCATLIAAAAHGEGAIDVDKAKL